MTSSLIDIDCYDIALIDTLQIAQYRELEYLIFENYFMNVDGSEIKKEVKNETLKSIN